MRIIRLLFGVLLGTTVLGVCSFVLILHAQGDRFLSVQTKSMEPVFYPGDAVLTKRVYLQELKPGDIVSYHRPDNASVIVTHRLISVDYNTGKTITMGDNNKTSDAPIPARLIIGKVYKIMPQIGSWLDWLHTTFGLLVIVYMPSALVIILEIKKLAMQLQYKKYKYHGYLFNSKHGVV